MSISKYLQSTSGIIAIRELGAQPMDITISGVGDTTVEYALWDLYQRTGTGAASTLVHKDGDETLTGVKTFQTGSDTGIALKDTRLTLNTTPTSTLETQIVFNDSANTNAGIIEYGKEATTGNSYVALKTRALSINNWTNIKLVQTPAGVNYLEIPTPPASSATTGVNAVTDGWVNDPTKSLNVVHRTSDEIIEGSKTFKSASTKFISSSLNNGGLAIETTSGNEVSLKHYNTSNVNDNKIVFTSDGKVTINTPTAASTSSLDIINVAWVNDPTVSNTNVVHRTGNETIAGVKTFSSVIQGTALNAQWADLAEMYETDEHYPIGTLVQFGGEKEMTASVEDVCGVISEKPALLMNSEEISGQPIAMVGRVRVRVVGDVNKFDYIKISEISGVARATEVKDDLVIGRALETAFGEDEKLVLCSVRFKI